LRWIVEDEHVAGLSFRNGHDVANGRYEVPILDKIFIEELQVSPDDAGAH
jgi:hypothetical protein